MSLFAVAILVLSTGAGFAISDVGTSRSIVLLLWLLAYGVAGAAVLDGLLRLRQLPPMPAALLLFVGLALASAAWSDATSVTLRRSIALAGTVLVGLAIARRLRPDELLDAVRTAVLLVVIASLALYAVGDPRAVDDVHDTLRGVLATKNTLGRVAAVGLVTAALLAYLDRRAWRRCALSAVPMLAALALTDSAGGLAVAFVGVSAVAGLGLWRGQRTRHVLPALVGAVLAVVVFALPAGLSPDDVATAAGRDPTLTGRTEIWEESLLAALERPATGYGFGAFWGLGGGGVESEAAARISTRLGEPVAHAHNGLLDVALGQGIPGVLLAVAVLLTLVRAGLRDVRADQVASAVLRLGFAGLVVLSTIAESGLLQENALLTVLLALAAGVRPTPAGSAGSVAAQEAAGRRTAGVAPVGPRRHPSGRGRRQAAGTAA